MYTKIGTTVADYPIFVIIPATNVVYLVTLNVYSRVKKR